MYTHYASPQPRPVAPHEPGPGPAERRRQARRGVLRRAQLLFSNTLHDCVIVDTSEGGARVQTAAPMALPERVVLRLADGQVITAKRVWSQGADTGLAFAEDEHELVPEMAARLMTVGEVLADGQFDIAVRKIRAARFFDDPRIRDATEAAESARMRLAAVLRSAALGTS